MKLATVNIPESITGVSNACVLSIVSGYVDLISSLEPLFLNDERKGAIRKQKAMPSPESTTIEIELWKLNEELSELKWQDLTIENATVMLANYALLDVEEKLAFQPILWAYLLYSTEWCSVLSNVIFSFLFDKDRITTTLKEICSVEQREAIVRCLTQLLAKLSSDEEPADFEGCLESKEEIETVSKVLRIWRANQ